MSDRNNSFEVILEWVELVIESCVDGDQLIGAENLVDNFNRLLYYKNVDISFIEDTKLRLFHSLEDKKDELKKIIS